MNISSSGHSCLTSTNPVLISSNTTKNVTITATFDGLFHKSSLKLKSSCSIINALISTSFSLMVTSSFSIFPNLLRTGSILSSLRLQTSANILLRRISVVSPITSVRSTGGVYAATASGILCFL